MTHTIYSIVYSEIVVRWRKWNTQENITGILQILLANLVSNTMMIGDQNKQLLWYNVCIQWLCSRLQEIIISTCDLSQQIYGHLVTNKETNEDISSGKSFFLDNFN